MDYILKSFSYILNPVLMPFTGALIYFLTAPRYIPENIIFSKLVGMIILTILAPLVLFLFLKNMGFITSFELPTVKQRKIPLLFQGFILLLVIKLVVDAYNYPELYFFFLGALLSTLSAIFLVIFNIKASLHMIGISAVTLFTITLSIHFGINLTLLIAILCIFCGGVATSRLHLKAHTNAELILGIMLGIIPQLMLVTLWL